MGYVLGEVSFFMRAFSSKITPLLNMDLDETVKIEHVIYLEVPTQVVNVGTNSFSVAS
jgi:hypothetical protein